MSEGTMQRRAQRDQGVSPTPFQRPGGARPLTRLLVCAAVAPAMLVAAGCSSDSGSGGKDKAADKPAASASPSPTPTVRAAVYRQLPEPCSVLSKKTLDELVPKAAAGKEGTSDDTATRGSCSWNSLDDNGVKGSQFRWLSVSLLRFDSDVTRGEGDRLARDSYAKQLKDAQATEGAKSLTTTPVTGTGDEAVIVGYDLKKKEGTFKQQTVLARVENVVVTLDYNGAGLAGDKTPDAGDLAKAAQKAAKEAVAAVTAANRAAGTPATPSASASTASSGSAGKTSSAHRPKTPRKSTSKRS